MTDVPEWLTAALADTSLKGTISGELSRVDPGVGWPAPVPGDVCVLRGMDGSIESGQIHDLPRPSAVSGDELTQRLVCVLESDNLIGVATVALITDEVDMADGPDVLVQGEQSGLSYSILVQRGLVAPVWWLQLSPPIASVPSELLDADENQVPTEPISATLDSDDPRIQFKDQELLNLRLLAQDCVSALFDGFSQAVQVLLDWDQISDELNQEMPRASAELISEVAPFADPPSIEAANLVSENTNLDLLDHDEACVLLAELGKSLRGSESSSVELEVAPSPDSLPLGPLNRLNLLSAVSGGARCVRIGTSDVDGFFDGAASETNWRCVGNETNVQVVGAGVL